MKTTSQLLIYLALVMLLSLGVMAGNESKKSVQKSEGINWLSFDKGIEALEQDTTGKHMFVDLTASWCGWCKKMEREAFSDKTVIDFVNESFIPVKIWGDSDKMLEIEGYRMTERSLATREFKVSGYPCFYFLTPEKAKIGPLRGYQTTEKLMNAFNWILERKYEEADTTTAKDKPQEK